MRTALAAQCFGAHHAVGAVDSIVDGGFVQGLVEARPAATGIEFGIGGKQRGIAAYTMVCAVSKIVGVASGKGAFGGGVARDLKRKRFGIAAGKPLFPFLFGFLDGIRYRKNSLKRWLKVR